VGSPACSDAGEDQGQEKIKAFSINHKGVKKVERQVAMHQYDAIYDYGNLSSLTRFKGTHPAVMNPWIARFDWREQLRFRGPARSMNPIKSKHDKPKYRLVSWIEKHLLGGRRLGEFKNYILVK
jgi:hypothetical protein